MRGPKPPMIELSEIERQALDELVRRHGTAQQIEQCPDCAPFQRQY
jgi:hypothetical protein